MEFYLLMKQYFLRMALIDKYRWNQQKRGNRKSVSDSLIHTSAVQLVVERWNFKKQRQKVFTPQHLIFFISIFVLFSIPCFHGGFAFTVALGTFKTIFQFINIDRYAIDNTTLKFLILLVLPVSNNSTTEFLFLIIIFLTHLSHNQVLTM